MNQNMFCYQCQETAGCSGCTKMGVCGKTPETAALQDLLVYATKGLAAAAVRLRSEGTEAPAHINELITQNLFTTITNVNFDSESIKTRIRETLDIRRGITAQIKDTAGLPEAALWEGNEEEFPAKAAQVGILSEENEDIRSLKELITYGLKGLAAYTSHAAVLRYDSPGIHAFLQKALAATLDDHLTADELTALALETGKYGVDAMALLDKANTETYGNPEITSVNIGVRQNPGILISAMTCGIWKCCWNRLKAPAWTYIPILRCFRPITIRLLKVSHFAGNYGNAWWQQKEEFESFHGPILMTTNCIVPPKDSYKDRLYTTGAAGYPGCAHISEDKDGWKDFSALIEQAKQCLPPAQIEQGTVTGGFAHAQVLALADKIVEAVKSGAVRKFVVMAGCDGREKSRSYYTDFAKALPKDTIILTAAAPNTASTSWTWAISAAFPGCWTQASATTPTLWQSQP